MAQATTENAPSTQTGKFYKFKLRGRIFDRLYLNEKTADVNFLLPKTNEYAKLIAQGAKEVEVEFVKIPAHKLILATASDVFHAIFYGGTKEEGDVTITDSYAGAFKEFLQCFYRGSGTFTKDNVEGVLYLAKKYLIADCLAACNSFLKDSVTPSDVCFVYYLAIRFERPDLMA